MKKVFLVGMLVLCAAFASATALADVRWGIYFNVPFPLWAPWYYYPPPYSYPYQYYHYPPPVLTPPPTAPYIEQAPARAAPPPSAPDWFYCPGSKNYYPYVRECPGGWQRVPSTPQSMR